MFISIDSIEYNHTAKKQELIISGDNLDAAILRDWDQDLADAPRATMRFDLNARGPKLYLLKVIGSIKETDCKTMEELVNKKLMGKIINISPNFLVNEG